jgi:hypothetical protein
MKINLPGDNRDYILKSKIDKFAFEYIINELHDVGKDDVIEYYFESSGHDNIYSIFRKFIIDQMIANNYEIVKNNKDILVSQSNQNLITDEDIIDYINSKPKLKQFLTQTIWTFYLDNINFNEIKQTIFDRIKGMPGVDINDDYLEWIIEDIISDEYVVPYMVDFIYDNADEFELYLEKTFLNTDLIKEMKIINILKTVLLEKRLNEVETAWHGSGHYFTRFKDAGIGGGQGSQAFGWGLYFGKDPEIAKIYQGMGAKTKTKTLFQGQTAEELGLKYENEIFFGLPSGLKTAKDYIDYAQETMELIEEEPEFEGKEEVLEKYRQFIEIIKDLSIEEEPRTYIYKVTLFPDKTPDYMDWDKKIPQEQVDKINNQAQKENVTVNVNTSMNGGEVYNTLEKVLGSPKNASLFLVKAGIDGNTHSNSSVRIVFDDRNIQIDKIYKQKEFGDIKENKKFILKEYSKSIIDQLITKWQTEMKKTLSNDDIKAKIEGFKQIAKPEALGKKVQLTRDKKPGGIIVPKKFIESDPVTGKKPLDPLNILNYTWKDLETVLDAYGIKGEKTSKDTHTTQEAELVDVKGVPMVYDGDGVKVYEGSNYDNCIKLNYAFKYKGEDDKIYTYSFCIGRKEPASNQYYTYRFGRGGSFRSFYFVADTTQDVKIEGDPANKENFKNWYHFFVIHAFDNGKFGVTDAVNYYSPKHELAGDKGVSWEEIGNFMKKNGGESGKEAWDKIKNLKDVFKYVSPSQEETDQALVRDNILNYEQFKDLNRNQKRIYISRRADEPNAFNSKMFSVLDVELKNLALRTGKGFEPTYNDIKDSPALGRSYARFKFTRAVNDYKSGKDKTPKIIPLPFIKFLTEEEKKEYLELFAYENLSFEYIEKYFGEQQAREYVNQQAKDFSYLPPSAIKYIDNPKIKALYQSYTKLFSNWEFSGKTNISEEELEKEKTMPGQSMDAHPTLYDDWRKLSPKDKKVAFDLAKLSETDPNKYLAAFLATPFFLQDGGQTYILLPNGDGKENRHYTEWIITDMEGNIKSRFNDVDEISLNDENINSGNFYSDDAKKIYNMSDLKINDEPVSLREIKRLQKLAGIIRY